MAIHFFEEEITFSFKNKRSIKTWIRETIESQKYKLGELNFIFCSDEYLLSMNVGYLNHHTYTDIITFDQSEEEEVISGDIFISVDRLKENAQKFGVTEADELCRLLIHGTLHLLGHTDKSPKQRAEMTRMEDLYLAKRTF